MISLAELLIPLLAIALGGLIILVPVTGFSIRFFLRPVLESLHRIRYGDGAREERALQDRRIQLLESEIQALQEQLRSFQEVRDFERQLR